MSMYLQKVHNMQKNIEKTYFDGILSATGEKSRIQIRIRKSVVGGSANPNPYHDVTDPQH